MTQRRRTRALGSFSCTAVGDVALLWELVLLCLPHFFHTGLAGAPWSLHVTSDPELAPQSPLPHLTAVQKLSVSSWLKNSKAINLMTTEVAVFFLIHAICLIVPMAANQSIKTSNDNFSMFVLLMTMVPVLFWLSFTVSVWQRLTSNQRRQWSNQVFGRMGESV